MTKFRISSLKLLMSHPYTRRFLFLGGVLLLMLNVIGRTHSLRNPGIYSASGTLFTNDILLTEKQFYEAIRRNGESDGEYLVKVTDAVSRGIAHYSQGGKDVARYYYLPLTENYLLWLSRYVSLVWKVPLGYQMQDILWYRFANWRRAVERGVGLCGTHGQVLLEVLRLNNIPARVVYLSRHVVVEASPDRGKTWWTLDPDYGVAIPEPTQALVSRPEAIVSYYKAKGYDAATLKSLQEVYSCGTPQYLNSVMEMHGRWKVYFEYSSYYLIWIIPIVLMLPLLADFPSAWRRSPAWLKEKFPAADQKANP